MKTILQTRSCRTAKLALLLALICAAVPTLQAQGPFIVENTNLQVDNTIIRTVSDTSWLIYSEHGNRGVFSLMTESSMIAQVMDLGYRTVKVNDFEIINNIVYFCGETVGTFPTKAVLGMFKLYTFPSCTVNYVKISEMMRFDKMELMESAIGVQVVLIGQTPSMDYKFVDVSEVFPNQWEFKIFSGTNSVVHILDDIAVTDNYVVFTGREIDADKGYLFCLNRPVSGTVPCQLLVDPLCYSYDVVWPLLIEHCEGDAYATVAMGEEDLLYVSAYDGYSHISTQKTITGYDLTEYCDIKYKKSKKILEILIHRSDYQTYNSLLFHYGTSLISPGVSSVTGHIAYGHWLSSVTNAIASFPGGMGFFLSTGFNGSGDLCIHRYSYLAFPCWGKEEIKVVDVENNEKWGELGLQCEEFTIPYEILPKTSYVHELTSVCGSLE